MLNLFNCNCYMIENKGLCKTMNKTSYNTTKMCVFLKSWLGKKFQTCINTLCIKQNDKIKCMCNCIKFSVLSLVDRKIPWLLIGYSLSALYGYRMN